MHLRLKLVYNVWNGLICINCISYYVWQLTDLKQSYPYGFVLPWVTLPFSTLTTCLYLASLLTKQTPILRLLVAFTNAIYCAASIFAIILDLCLFIIAYDIYFCPDLKTSRICAQRYKIMFGLATTALVWGPIWVYTTVCMFKYSKENVLMFQRA